jgi:uncharacterized protein
MSGQPTVLPTSEENPGAPAAFHVMLKPRGAICNLDCQYCFYLAKERLYPGSRFRMADDLLERYTQQYIEAQRVPEVTFAWQGGEPTLMGLEFFRRAVELQEKYRPAGTTIHNTLQTNGTMLNDAWGAFLKEHDFLIGLSLDGPRDLHDAYRVDKGSQPTYDAVMQGLKVLKRHSVEFNVLTCVHAANVEFAQTVYRFLRDEVGSQFMQFIPIVRRRDDSAVDVTDDSVTARQYGEFLIKIFEEWVRRDVGRVYVQIFDVALAAWAGLSPGLCIFEETCGTALAMEHNGDLYACDHFVEPAYFLGNIRQQHLIALVGAPMQQQFGLDKRDSLPGTCRACEVRFVCNGGCPKNRFIETADGEPGLNYLCEGYKAFFKHIDPAMRFMAGELQAGRAPANVMAHVARQDRALEEALAHAGRNDACPCGSGRKVKHCHGRK